MPLAFTLCCCLLLPALVFAQPQATLQNYTNPLLAQHPGSSGAYVLEKGEESLLARAWLVDHAQHFIEVQYFIWSSDNIGILAAEALLRAAERGVKVRVIVDDLLIDAPADSMLALAQHPNIEVKIYNPKHKVGVSKLKRVYNMLSDFRSFNQRMHDKVLIVDGQVAITGGRNMADEYYDYDQAYNFRDRDILLLGPVVRQMGESFYNFWHSPLSVELSKQLHSEQALPPPRIKEIYGELHDYATEPANFVPEVRQALAQLADYYPALQEAMAWQPVEFIHDMPGKNDGSQGLGGGGQATQRLTEALAGAKKRVTIQSPYLVMPEGAIDFFGQLVARGVEVRVSTNSLASTDNLMAFSGYRSQRRDILAAGVEVFEYKPFPQRAQQLMERWAKKPEEMPVFAIHAKTMVIDGEQLFIGTFNLDPRSANLNTEIGVLINNGELAGQVEEEIVEDMAPANSWSAADGTADGQASLAKRFKVRFWRWLPIEKLL